MTKILENKSKEIRRRIVETIVHAGKGHIGGALSSVDLLVTLYYGDILRFDPKKPDWEKRDRFIFSKGHAGIALYVVLSDLGFFSKEELKNFNQGGSFLAEHPDPSCPGIEVVSGSLGHGLNICAGMALAAKLDKKDYASIALLGDGECYEGTVWEAAMFASHHGLNNLIAIIDRNQLAILDKTENITRLEPFAEKWISFGWEVKEIDGHEIKDIEQSLVGFRSRNSNKPLVIIANTIKGKGISFMENQVKWHHGVPNREHLETALKELK